MAFPPGSLAHLAPGAGVQAVTGAGGPHLAGVYPPVSLPGDLIAREREKLERLGKLIFSCQYKGMGRRVLWEGMKRSLN